MGELNLVTGISTGYHPKEVAYQVRKQNLCMYFRLVEFDQQKQNYHKLNQVDVVEVPMLRLGQHFNDYLNDFYNFINSKELPSLFGKLDRIYSKDKQLKYKFSYIGLNQLNEIHFSVIYEYESENVIHTINLINGYIKNEAGGSDIYLYGKSSMLKIYFKELLLNKR